MNIVLIANFKNNSSLTKLAKATVQVCGNSLNIKAYDALNAENLKNIDLAIQFLPTNEFIKIPNCKNVGILLNKKDAESTYTNIVDEVWDDYPEIVQLIDVEKVETLDVTPTNGDFIFYTINDNYDKSYTDILLKAFTLEFDPAEPVSLVVKTNRVIDNEILTLNKSLNLYQDLATYKKHIVITRNLSESQLYSLHKTYDVFINTDGNYTATEANFFGNCSIFVDNLISIDFLRKQLRNTYVNRNTEYNYININDITTYLLRKIKDNE